MSLLFLCFNRTHFLLVLLLPKSPLSLPAGRDTFSSGRISFSFHYLFNLCWIATKAEGNAFFPKSLRNDDINIGLKNSDFNSCCSPRQTPYSLWLSVPTRDKGSSLLPAWCLADRPGWIRGRGVFIGGRRSGEWVGRSRRENSSRWVCQWHPRLFSIVGRQGLA